jgi:hypothetical protein
MIDTDKYEGHSEMIDANEIGEIWEYLADTISEDSRGRAEANYNLVADAPDLLAEVIRLREELDYAKVTIDDWDKSGPCVTVYLEGCEYVGMLRLYKDENGKVIE